MPITPRVEHLRRDNPSTSNPYLPGRPVPSIPLLEHLRRDSQESPLLFRQLSEEANEGGAATLNTILARTVLNWSRSLTRQN